MIVLFELQQALYHSRILERELGLTASKFKRAVRFETRHIFRFSLHQFDEIW